MLKSNKIKMAGEQNKKILEEILRALALGVAITLVLSSPYAAKKIIKGIRHELKNRKLKKEYLMQKFYYLRKKGLISFVEKGDEVEIIITEDGKKYVLKYDIESIVVNKPRTWNGEWQLVFFDIPESFKTARDALVNKLKDLGFIKFNASVWIYPYECQREIDFISEFFNIGKYVHYAKVSRITNEGALKTVFKI